MKPTIELYSKTDGNINTWNKISNQIKHSNEIVTVKVGQEIKIRCEVENEIRILNYPSNVILRKNGNVVSPPKPYYKKINFQASKNENGDRYECEAQNGVGSQTSYDLSLNVQCKSTSVLSHFLMQSS